VGSSSTRKPTSVYVKAVRAGAIIFAIGMVPSFVWNLLPKPQPDWLPIAAFSAFMVGLTVIVVTGSFYFKNRSDVEGQPLGPADRANRIAIPCLCGVVIVGGGVGLIVMLTVAHRDPLAEWWMGVIACGYCVAVACFCLGVVLIRKSDAPASGSNDAKSIG
jgi:dipeptide/tripeptide permease